MEGLLQPTHMFFILAIVLVIFGPKKLPECTKPVPSYVLVGLPMIEAVSVRAMMLPAPLAAVGST